MTKAILTPFHHFLCFDLALSPLETLKELRRAGSCFAPFLLLIDFAGKDVFSFHWKS